MSEFSELIKEYLDEKTSMLHTALLGRITSVSEKEADVQPLQGGFPLLKSLPLLTHRYEYTDTLDTDTGSGPTETRYVEGPVYEVGDIVLVIFLERSRDGKGNRKHSLEDGIIVGMIK